MKKIPTKEEYTIFENNETIQMILHSDHIIDLLSKDKSEILTRNEFIEKLEYLNLDLDE